MRGACNTSLTLLRVFSLACAHPLTFEVNNMSAVSSSNDIPSRSQSGRDELKSKIDAGIEKARADERENP